MFNGIKSVNYTNIATVTTTTNRTISSKQFSLYTFATNLPTKHSGTRILQRIASKTKLSSILVVYDTMGCSILSSIHLTFSDKATILRNPFTQKLFIAITTPVQSATNRFDCKPANMVANMLYKRKMSHKLTTVVIQFVYLFSFSF